MKTIREKEDLRFEYFLHDKHVLHTRTVVLDAYKAVYFFIAKVACRSLKTVYAQTMSKYITQHSPAEIYTMINDGVFSVRDNEFNTTYGDYYKFCFVRNPWDRLVSCFRGKILTAEEDERLRVHNPTLYYKNYVDGVAKPLSRYGNVFRLGMSFEEFVYAVCEIPDNQADVHLKSQSAFITDTKGTVVVDFIGKFERLTDDFVTLSRNIGLPHTTLPHLGKTKRTIYPDYYSEHTKNIVRQRYARDIELFEYEF